MKVFVAIVFIFVLCIFAIVNATQHFSKPVAKPVQSEPQYKNCSGESGVHYDRCLNYIAEAKMKCGYLKNSSGYVECVKKYGGM